MFSSAWSFRSGGWGVAPSPAPFFSKQHIFPGWTGEKLSELSGEGVAGCVSDSSDNFSPLAPVKNRHKPHILDLKQHILDLKPNTKLNTKLNPKLD